VSRRFTAGSVNRSRSARSAPSFDPSIRWLRRSTNVSAATTRHRRFNGAAALIVPSVTARRLGNDLESSAAAIYPPRMFGVRTVVLGAELLNTALAFVGSSASTPRRFKRLHHPVSFIWNRLLGSRCAAW
jgi:hypothetical protein